MSASTKAVVAGACEPAIIAKECDVKAFDAKAFLARAPESPGVYRMLDAAGTILYVGKAKDLKKRLASYFRSSGLAPKTAALVGHIADIQLTATHTETEALLLENHLIKQHHPRYNVLMRDDKSYPEIFLGTHHTYPRLGYHRGPHRQLGRYFGPYPSSLAVKETLSLLQKIFRLRYCVDHEFQNRSRPCMQYQIKRCTAPCVGFVTQADYAQDVKDAQDFLEGRSQQVIHALVARMEQAAERLAFEEAVILRDRISQLRAVSEKQYISTQGGSVDVLACALAGGLACIEVLTIRDGRNLGGRAYFPKNTEEHDEAEILTAFISQMYLEHAAPRELLVSHEPHDRPLLEQALSDVAGHAIRIQSAPRGDRARWVDMARHNAELALGQRLASRGNQMARMEALVTALALRALPQRIECFDISHTLGESTVASCVVFGMEGARKEAYRRYNIEGITAGDDYAAMQQALQRRFAKAVEEDGALPDVLLIDGGAGQVARAQDVLQALGLSEAVMIVGVAKGVERRPGEETLLIAAQKGHHTDILDLPAHSPALHLIQQVRDEAHRFAITGHRARRAKTRETSSLESIAGIGSQRRQQLLKHFGGIQALQRAGVEDICSVPGISAALAQRIYDHFHG
ncbi:MAG: excinuclease ABC subunit UvrC [Halothiobacillaceae bacterium]|nr:excinuclease ABC subunit UvrC [Halothiobacillaceae bacterium]